VRLHRRHHGASRRSGNSRA